ncbi:branched-chain amino acid ABC transporter permease [Halorubrum sp. JWXQ-INN 858]|uniref:branched-chain amino acid ABC transporter permease n=1 Tax=Halorubrum sp. JWXQ-INN 858 TaxID=2690782 RepID=UPI001356AEBB|nr:branched-chain amino acid ABC transporter permease [Halorubrum sp. JWXQ-INN 858]MWV63935.1 branched-chain amino acid ABC transporter permease [Halorubrum sp. JWXQ-INN 858]
MVASNTIDRGRTLLREQPVLALAGVAGAVLVLDLLARLAGVEVPLVGDRTFGGSLGMGRFGGLLWNGIIVGLIFGLAGIGLSMTYSILNFANFSHGDLVTTGAFTGWGAALLVAGWGVADVGHLLLVRPGSGANPNEIGASIAQAPLSILIGAAVAAVATVVVAVAIDRAVYKPMRDRGGIALLIASIGVALALRYVIQFVYGSRNRGVTSTQDVNATVLGITIDLHEATLVLVAAGLMLGMHLMLQRTKLGKAMRAMADNKDLALVTGIPTERVVTATWVLGGALAGVAGYLYVLERGTIEFNLGWFLLLFIFAAVILGGIGSIYGAIAGGFVIGFVHEVSLIWVPSDFNAAAAFTIMILVLLYRPQGLFGGVTTA